MRPEIFCGCSALDLGRIESLNGHRDSEAKLEPIMCARLPEDAPEPAQPLFNVAPLAFLT
jgi:hypothetical protein